MADTVSLQYIPITQSGGIIVCNGNGGLNIVCMMQQATFESPATIIFPSNSMNASSMSVPCLPQMTSINTTTSSNNQLKVETSCTSQNMSNKNIKNVANNNDVCDDKNIVIKKQEFVADINTSTKTITQSTMKRGRHIASTQKPFVCETCGKGYKYRCNYRSHIKIHTDEAFVCSFCNKRFGRKSNFKEHVRIHTGEAPYKCQYCKRTFKQHHGWKDHLRVHTGEKPYLCKVCGKRFTVGHNLNVHMRIHTGERPYCCDICHKSYRQKSAYNSHMKHVHNARKK